MGLLIIKNGVIADYSNSRSHRHVNPTSTRRRKEEAKKDEGDHESEQPENHREAYSEKHKKDPYRSAINSYRDQKSESSKAKSIASLSPITVAKEQSIEEALNLMKRYKIHHLLFVDDKKSVIGIVSDRDILGERRSDRAFDFSIREVIVAKESTDIKIICSLMIDKLVSAVPLVNEKGQLTGIITKTDILEFVFRNQHLEVYV